MLHQRTQEVLQYFEEGIEMACFETKDELVEKVKYYLGHDAERNKIREAGYQRAQQCYSLDKRAAQILDILKQQGIK